MVYTSTTHLEDFLRRKKKHENVPSTNHVYIYKVASLHYFFKTFLKAAILAAAAANPKKTKNMFKF